MGYYAFEVTGFRNLAESFNKAKIKVQKAVDTATRQSLDLIWIRAQAILTAKIYERADRPAFYPAFTDDLLNSFVADFARAGNSAIGELKNTSKHAIWIAYGTESHFISPTQMAALHWIDPVFGTDVFDSVGHDVTGIGQSRDGHEAMAPVQFMSQALEEVYPRVIGIYKDRITEALN